MDSMDMRIEVVFLGVTDVDRAKSFYVDQVGFHPDHDQRVSEGLRFVQLTPPGSACSVAFGEGITAMPPGAQQGVMMVVEDAGATRERLLAAGVDASEVDEQPWGRFVSFADPDGNTWTLQQLPPWR
jgi:catechol 2,3-dioxygenase-like lactoylglutathione lyase family enzyme